MSMFKTVRLGPDGEVIQDSGWTDDGSWSAESIITVIDADGKQQEIRRKDFGKDTKSLADSDLSNMLGQKAQSAATKGKATEYDAALQALNAMAGGIKDKEKTFSSLNDQLYAKTMGGSWTDPNTGQVTNVNRLESQVGQGDSGIDKNSKGMGFTGPNNTIGMAAKQKLRQNFMGSLADATTGRATELANDRQKMNEQAALAFGKTGKKSIYDPATGTWSA